MPPGVGCIRAHAIDRRLSLEARSGLHWRHAIWSVPGGGDMAIVLHIERRSAAPRTAASGKILHLHARSAGR